MTGKRDFDMAIVGGGLSGLSLSIQLARTGHSVILFEKQHYPFHRVCGEYISMESFEFLRNLSVDLTELDASRISKLEVTTVTGDILQQDLFPGGMGISRHRLDHVLADIAIGEGVNVLQGTTVQDVNFNVDHFAIQTTAGDFSSRVAAGCFGKRSKLDIQWRRSFIDPAKGKKGNYVGIKYHIKSATIPADTIFLHHFPGGYCGIVKVESDQYCLCYLTTADNLARSGNNIAEMEWKILSKNPVIRNVLNTTERVNPEPQVISQISFTKKSTVEDHVLMMGDAAGMITPLCGNGMSMALHAGKIAGGLIHSFFEGKIDRQTLEKEYERTWKREFSRRLWVGRKVQGIFGRPALLSGLIRTGNLFPSITKTLVRQTHGRSF